MGLFSKIKEKFSGNKKVNEVEKKENQIYKSGRKNPNGYFKNPFDIFGRKKYFAIKTNKDTKTDTGTTTTSSETDAGLLSFDLIQYLNEKTGSDYKADKANAVRVQSLLDSGYSPDQLRTVIDKKVDEWYGDSKMRSYLRPSTLLGV